MALKNTVRGSAQTVRFEPGICMAGYDEKRFHSQAYTGLLGGQACGYAFSIVSVGKPRWVQECETEEYQVESYKWK
jgi:hypothetical protein